MFRAIAVVMAGWLCLPRRAHVAASLSQPRIPHITPSVAEHLILPIKKLGLIRKGQEAR